MTPVYERYAGALYKSSEKLGCTDTVADELSAMEKVLTHCSSYLSNPLIGVRQKTALFQSLLKGKVSPLTLEFILLITAQRHLKHFCSVAEHFRQISGHGKTVVRLRVPFAYDQNLLGQLKRRLIKEKLIPADAADATDVADAIDVADAADMADTAVAAVAAVAADATDVADAIDAADAADADNIQFDIIEDKELIGGFVASCDGFQIDTSLKATLMKLLSSPPGKVGIM